MRFYKENQIVHNLLKRPTLNETKSWTRQVRMASLPTGTVVFAIGALKLGSAVNKEINIFINAETLRVFAKVRNVKLLRYLHLGICNWTVGANEEIDFRYLKLLAQFSL